MSACSESFLRASCRSCSVWLAVAVGVMLSMCSPQVAKSSDTILTLDVRGKFIPPSVGAYSDSSITVDVTKDQILNAFLSLPSEGLTFTGAPAQLAGDIFEWSAGGDNLFLAFLTPLNGKTVLASTTLTGPHLLAESLPKLSPTPEPASILLFGTGLLAIAAFLRNRQLGRKGSLGQVVSSSV
jgi:hypothetical protein